MDSKIVQVALNGLENILRFGEQESKTTGGPNPYAVIIEEVFGLDKIEFLQVIVVVKVFRFLITFPHQSHENMEIYQKAFDIIERYFGTEEEDKDVSETTAQWGKSVNIILSPVYRLLLPRIPISSPSGQAETHSRHSKALISRSEAKRRTWNHT